MRVRLGRCAGGLLEPGEVFPPPSLDASPDDKRAASSGLACPAADIQMLGGRTATGSCHKARRTDADAVASGGGRVGELDLNVAGGDRCGFECRRGR
jgi:hypothetical protein